MSYYIIIFLFIKMPLRMERSLFLKLKCGGVLSAAPGYDKIDEIGSRNSRQKPDNREQEIAYEFAIDYRKSAKRKNLLYHRGDP